MPSKPCLWLQGPPGAERGHGGEDDVGLHRAQAVEIERQRAQHLGRQVGDHDVGGGHQLADDLAPLGTGGIERHRALVAVHHQVHRPDAVGADRRHPAVFTAADPLDPDDVGAEIGQQRRAVRPGDVASEVEDPDPVENTVQRSRHARSCRGSPECDPGRETAPAAARRQAPHPACAPPEGCARVPPCAGAPTIWPASATGAPSSSTASASAT